MNCIVFRVGMASVALSHAISGKINASSSSKEPPGQYFPLGIERGEQEGDVAE